MFNDSGERTGLFQCVVSFHSKMFYGVGPRIIVGKTLGSKGTWRGVQLEQFILIADACILSVSENFMF